MGMNEGKIEDLLLKLIEDVAFIKSKISNIEEQDLGARLDAIEAQNERYEHSIKALENRANKMEEFTRSNIVDTKKQQTSVFISLGIAIFSAVLSVITRLL